MIAPRMRGHRERLELDLAVGVEPLDRADQPEEAVRDEILLVDVRRQARSDAAGDELHERRVGQDQPVAELPVPRLPELLPQRLGLVPAARHAERIRRADGETPQAAASDSSRQVGHPGRERRGGERDDPRPPRPRRPHTRRARPARARRAREPQREPAMLPPARGTFVLQPRGVAQLVEHRSPKPGVAGSSPVAPAGFTPQRLRHGRMGASAAKEGLPTTSTGYSPTCPSRQIGRSSLCG